MIPVDILLLAAFASISVAAALFAGRGAVRSYPHRIREELDRIGANSAHAVETSEAAVRQIQAIAEEVEETLERTRKARDRVTAENRRAAQRTVEVEPNGADDFESRAKAAMMREPWS